MEHLIEAFKKQVGDKLHGASVRLGDFEVAVVKHRKERVSEKADQRKSHNGRGVMFKAMVKTIVVDQNIESLVLYLPALMSDSTDRIG